MKRENRQLHVGCHTPINPIADKVPTKITLDGDCALRLADMARKMNCSKSDVVNALIGRYANVDNTISELQEYAVLGCREW